MSKIDIISAIFIAVVGTYWFVYPESNLEPLLVAVPAILYLVGRIFRHFWSNNAVNELPFTCNVETSNIRCFNEYVDYAVHLNIDLFFKEKVAVKNISIVYKEHYGIAANGQRSIDVRCVNRIDGDLLSNSLEWFQQKLPKDAINIKFPVSANDKTLLPLTFYGHVSGERLPDGWEGLSLDGWLLRVEYNNGSKYEQSIVLQPHSETLKRPVKWKSIGFIGN
ncbi:hypothetical protein [Vibrio harveyi]|uniref:hypothetical protein n=1 Tax=Vibrio harveyi TaxID=669 RepID=UPI0023800696|nr:hypothetical protein [Vibrio harveyi]